MSFRTLKFKLEKEDRNRPSFHRSELSSRRILMGEHTNRRDRLQPQDIQSQHRGRKLTHL